MSSTIFLLSKFCKNIKVYLSLDVIVARTLLLLLFVHNVQFINRIQQDMMFYNVPRTLHNRIGLKTDTLLCLVQSLLGSIYFNVKHLGITKD